MNLTSSELATHGFAKERRKIGSSLADVDPMNIDKTVSDDWSRDSFCPIRCGFFRSNLIQLEVTRSTFAL